MHSYILIKNIFHLILLSFNRFLEMTQSDMEPDPDSTFSNDDERNHHNKVK